MGLVAGEFSGTEGVDLATANEGGAITLLSNHGDGVFDRAGAIQINERFTPTDIVVGSFNSDEIDDIAISADDLESFPGFNGAVAIYRSTEPLKYQGTPFTVGVLPVCIAVGDLTGDGLEDLGSCDSDDEGVGQISLLRRNASGTFATAQGLDLNGVAPSRMIPADIDGDNRPDMLVLDEDGGTVSISYGRGVNPIFDPPFSLATLDTPVAAIVDYIDGDDRLDVAVASRLGGRVHVFLQTSPRVFDDVGSFEIGFLPLALAAADFDRDEKLDLIGANYGSSDAVLLYGNGDGTFRFGEVVAVGDGPVGIVVADLNGDEKIDFATVNQDDVRFGLNMQSITVVLNGVTPPFTPTPTATSTRTPTATPPATRTPTITRTPRISATPTRTGSPAPTVTPAGPSDINCDGRIDADDVATATNGIFDPEAAGCSSQTPRAATLIEILLAISAQ